MSAVVVSFSIVIAGILYYYFVKPKLSLAVKGISTKDIPGVRLARTKEARENRKIVIPMETFESNYGALEFGRRLAEGEDGTELVPIYVVENESILPMASDYEEYKQEVMNTDLNIARLRDYERSFPGKVKPMVLFSHRKQHSIASTAKDLRNSFLILCWDEARSHARLRGFISDVLKKATSDVGILIMNDLNPIGYKNILFPYGGGPYSQMTVVNVNWIAESFDAKVTILRAIDNDEEETEVVEDIKKIAEQVSKKATYQIVRGDLEENVVNLSHGYDLIILGVSLDWDGKGRITGFRTERISSKVNSPILLIKSYSAILNRRGIRNLMRLVKRLTN